MRSPARSTRRSTRTCSTSQLPAALDLLTEIVTSPRFSNDDVEMERGVILEEIKMVEDTPDDLVHEIFVTAFWPDHPLGRPILGTEEDDRPPPAHEDHRALPGDVSSLQCHLRRVRQPQTGGCPAVPGEALPGRRTPRRFAANGARRRPKQHVIFRPKRELEQVHLCLGSRGFPQQNQERYARRALPTPSSAEACPRVSSSASASRKGWSTASPPATAATCTAATKRSTPPAPRAT